MKAARRYGAIVSYDLNYRESLWRSIGGKKQAQEINRSLAMTTPGDTSMATLNEVLQLMEGASARIVR